MTVDILALAGDLERSREPFVLATVVASKAPTSAKPGARAIVRRSVDVAGWVGGSCTDVAVRLEAEKALADGRSRLLLLGTPTAAPLGLFDNVVSAPMACQSEGSLAVYLEPFLPAWELAIAGQSPIAQSLCALAKRLGWSVWVFDPDATVADFPEADVIAPSLEGLAAAAGGRTLAVVATMGHYDEDAVRTLAATDAPYVGLVSSPRRGGAVLEFLRGSGMPEAPLARVKCPAGLDIGAASPEEIALSILARWCR